MGAFHIERNCGFYAGVVITRVSPDYYAGGVDPSIFEIEGYNLDRLEGYVGVVSYENNRPEMYIDSLTDGHTFSIQVLSDRSANLVHKESTTPTLPSYLGMIVNPTTLEVLWVNNTRPLPS